ncbi:MAG: response regulator [Chloroflexota bacterium]|nr:response regulator [Chloroflexota bacterium]
MQPTRVVLVEAQPLFRVGVRGVLVESGKYHVVAETGCSSEATTLGQSEAVDLMLIGMQGADLGGLQIAERLSQRHPKPLIVFLAPKPDEDGRDTATGAAAVLRRDISSETLIRVLDQLVADERRLRHADAARSPLLDEPLARCGCG